MKLCCLLFPFIFLAPFITNAQQYTVSGKDSKIEFSVNYHKNGNKEDNEVVKGRFSNMKGNITFDPNQLGKSSFDVTINSASITTGLPDRDKELKHESFFSSSLYPVIHFKSSSVTTDRPGGIIYILHGDLTIKGITKPVNIQFTATQSGNAYLFRGSFHINRLDYSLGEKGPVDKEVTLFMEVKALKK